jgi:hypothetical protein
MHGVPQQLDLTPFVGRYLDYITLCQYQIGFSFSGEPGTKYSHITVRGCWEFKDPQLVLIDKGDFHCGEAEHRYERGAYKIHLLLGRTVTDTKINPPESFTLIFDNGMTLTIIDDCSGYECCEIQFDDTEVFI